MCLYYTFTDLPATQNIPSAAVPAGDNRPGFNNMPVWAVLIVASESISIEETNPEPLPSVVDTKPKKPIGKSKFIPPIAKTEV